MGLSGLQAACSRIGAVGRVGVAALRLPCSRAGSRSRCVRHRALARVARRVAAGRPLRACEDMNRARVGSQKGPHLGARRSRGGAPARPCNDEWAPSGTPPEGPGCHRALRGVAALARGATARAARCALRSALWHPGAGTIHIFTGSQTARKRYRLRNIAAVAPQMKYSCSRPSRPRACQGIDRKRRGPPSQVNSCRW